MGWSVHKYRPSLERILQLMAYTGYLPLDICPSDNFRFLLKRSSTKRVVMMLLDFVTGIISLMFLPMCYFIVLGSSFDIWQLLSLQYYTRILGGNTTSTLARISYKAVSVLGVWIYSKTGRMACFLTINLFFYKNE
jgi:hypothetical protein